MDDETEPPWGVASVVVEVRPAPADRVIERVVAILLAGDDEEEKAS